MFVYDCLLKIQYESHQKDWIKFGRPLGLLFFNPEGFSAWLSIKRWRASQKFPYRMFFMPPPWVKDDPEALKLLWIYRLLGILSFFFALLFFVFGVGRV
ncbi:hypothetical protein BH20ACI2_BH20ACI2_01970 [soil metagenome]